MRQSPFFEGVRQVELEFGGETGRLPVFYYDGRAITALFPARMGAIRELLPDPRFEPARLAPGLGAVAVSAFEYRDTDIGPYNELAVSVVLGDPVAGWNPPGRALARAARRRQLHAYVHHLPVTTEIARAGGVEFYGYPKFIASIEFSESAERLSCRLAEGEEEILRLSGERIPAPRSERMQVFSHLWMNRQPQSSELKLNAIELGHSVRPRAARLQLGDRHPISVELGRLLASRRPIAYTHMPRFEAILFGPDRLTLPLLARAREVRAAPLGAR